MSATGQEIMPLKGELDKMLPLWKKLSMPVTVIQGLEDDLVPPENAGFCRKDAGPGPFEGDPGAGV